MTLHNIPSMSTETYTSQLEGKVKEKLGIKWTAAKKIAQDAKGSLPAEAKIDEVLAEAELIFYNLPPAEQDEMLVKPKGVAAAEAAENEPAWKKKAREQAERREAEWDKKYKDELEEAAAAEKYKENQEALARGENPLPEINGPKKVTRTTRTTINGDVEEVVHEIEQEAIDRPTVKMTKVEYKCCTIS